MYTRNTGRQTKDHTPFGRMKMSSLDACDRLRRTLASDHQIAQAVQSVAGPDPALRLGWVFPPPPEDGLQRPTHGSKYRTFQSAIQVASSRTVRI